MTNDLVLICDACRKPIAGGARGYLWVDRGEVVKRRQEVAEWRKEHTVGEGQIMASGSDLLEYPVAVRWQAHHGVCDPAPDAWAYGIGSDALGTYGQLLERTAHLMEKRWLRLTDWNEVLRGVPRGKTRLVAARQS